MHIAELSEYRLARPCPSRRNPLDKRAAKGSKGAVAEISSVTALRGA